MNKDRDYFYLQFSDVPDEDDEIDIAYKDVPEAPVRPLETQEIVGQTVARQAFGDAGCKSCGQTPSSFIDHLKTQWNQGLNIEEVRLCALCGNTKLTKRVKDAPNKYTCDDCRSNESQAPPPLN